VNGRVNIVLPLARPHGLLSWPCIDKIANY
jgi:hypothetical protein